MFFSRRLHALLNLLWTWVRHRSRALFGERREPGLTTFQRNYSGDGIVPLSAAEVAAQPGYETCVACQLCDAACPRVAEESVPVAVFPGPSLLVQAVTRSTSALPVMSGYLAVWEQCGECARCETVCPARVPLKRLAAFAAAKAAVTARQPAPRYSLPLEPVHE